ncbi:MAG: DNA ligase [Propionivibrio sp.]|nr:DNA ligase [Propionivibrio sp.]
MRNAKRSWIANVVLIVSAWGALVASIPALSAEEPPRLLLAETVRRDTDVTRYLVSEKLDGVRAFWDGRVLVTRGGHVINAPTWFVAHFPARSLDGELWAGRGQFERTSATVRRQTPDDAEWRQLRYMIFELPQAEGDFRERVRAMQAIVAEAAVPWLQAVEQFTVRDRKELDAKLARVIKAGGEGLMLHRADAPYLTGRHDALLKMKPLYDAEATVVGHLPGRGKYLGMLGALRVRTEAGIEFSLGSGLNDVVRRAPPPVGTIITYRYREVTERGIPRFASYHRVRE